jgi:hypothetical protein
MAVGTGQRPVAPYVGRWLAVVVGEGPVDGCWHQMWTDDCDCLLLPDRDQWLAGWLAGGTGQRPVAGCFYRMGTGDWLLLPNRDQWMDVGTVWKAVTACFCLIRTTGWMLAPGKDQDAGTECGPVAGCCCEIGTSDGEVLRDSIKYRKFLQ